MSGWPVTGDDHTRSSPKPMLSVPPTSREIYISGHFALNVPDETGFPADWHPHIWEWADHSVLDMFGEGQVMDTNPALGDWGVRDAVVQIRRMRVVVPPGVEQVWVARGPRALLDLAAKQIHDTGQPRSARCGFHAWIDEEDIEETARRALLLKGLVDPTAIDDWLVDEVGWAVANGDRIEWFGDALAHLPPGRVERAIESARASRMGITRRSTT